MADPDLVARTARVLIEHTLSLAEYQVIGSAGYRVTLPPAMFVSHAFTLFVGREGPVEIGEWRPNRFFLHTAGHHGVLRYVGGARPTSHCSGRVCAPPLNTVAARSIVIRTRRR
jgi:hypothetical protein